MIKLIVSQYNKTLFKFKFDEDKFDRIGVVVEYLEFVGSRLDINIEIEELMTGQTVYCDNDIEVTMI